MSLKRNIQFIRRNISSKHCRALIEAKKSLKVRMPDDNIACFNFMIDFELFWGNGNLGGKDHPLSQRISAAKKQQENFQPFLKLVESLNFPVSWAALGILAERNITLKEEEQFKPAWAKNSEWYSLPQELIKEEALFNGRSYLESISKCKSPVEILSHGFAHIDYSDPAATKNVAENDLSLSLKLLREFSHQPINAFVYPCNKHHHKEILRPNNIQIIRGENHEWIKDDELIQTPLGFWISPGSMSFKELLPSLEEAVRNQCWIHPWMHLIECDLNENDLENFYRPLFEWALKKNSEGKLKLVTFSDLRA